MREARPLVREEHREMVLRETLELVKAVNELQLSGVTEMLVAAPLLLARE
jgi:hypothetical protein